MEQFLEEVKNLVDCEWTVGADRGPNMLEVFVPYDEDLAEEAFLEGRTPQQAAERMYESVTGD